MPTVIDTLIVKLGLDPKDLNSKSAEYDKKLKSLEGSTKKVTSANKDAGKSLEELGRTLGGFLALIGGTYAIKSFVMDTINANAALDRFSKNIGLSVTSVSAWGNAVEEMGGSSKNLQGTLAMLSQQQTQLRLTGESSLIPYFARLGINIGAFGQKVRPVDDILLDLSERFSHMDRAQANNMGRMLGIDQDTLNLLLQGREAVELMIKRQKEHNAVTKQEAEQDAKWQRSIVQLNQTFNKFGRDLLQDVAPALDKVIGWLTKFADWIHTNTGFVKDFLAVIAAGIAAISVAMMANEIGLITVAIVALAAGIALLWDDYQHWKDGGNSFVDWKIWEDRINAVREALEHLRDELKSVWDKTLGRKVTGDDTLNRLTVGDDDDEKKKARLKRWFGVTGGGHSKAKDAARSAGSAGTAAQFQKYFESKGMSPAVAAGLAANIIAESTGDPTQIGDHGHAYGLLQWHEDRQANFAKFAGHDIRKSTTEEQLAFIVQELSSTEGPAGKALLGATSARQAGEIASRRYVRPFKVEEQAQKRGALAEQLAGVSGASSTIAGASTGGGSSSTMNDHSRSVQTGDINIFTQATDAQGIARDFSRGTNYLFASQANGGLT